MRKNVISAGQPAIVCLAIIACALSGCGGSGSSAGSPVAVDPTSPGQPTGTDPGQTTPPTHSAALSISGTPGTSAVVGTAYNFSPSVSGAPAGSQVTYSIQNKPAWASFDVTSGTLAGTPDASSVGTYSNIVISATSGSVTAALAAFAIGVTDVTNGTATLAWDVPSINVDGTPLTNLAGFHIYYGTSASSMTQMKDIPNAGVATYVLTNLSSATWYFGVKAYTTSGTESAISNVASKTIS